jgi:hypothetical protein
MSKEFGERREEVRRKGVERRVRTQCMRMRKVPADLDILQASALHYLHLPVLPHYT